MKIMMKWRHLRFRNAFLTARRRGHKASRADDSSANDEMMEAGSFHTQHEDTW